MNFVESSCFNILKLQWLGTIPKKAGFALKLMPLLGVFDQ